MQEDFPNIHEVQEMMAVADTLAVSCTFNSGSAIYDVVPRTSPVFCAASYLGRYYWLSNAGSKHSRNIEQAHRGALMPLSKPRAVITGSVARVGNPYEREEAYGLLKAKARTLPEKLSELGPDCLRDIYSMRADGTDHRMFNDDNYAVLGTIETPHYQARVNPLMRRLDFQLQDQSLVVQPFAGMYGHYIHACLFDSKAKQGTGIGLYFQAQVEKHADHHLLKPSGEVMVNGALFRNGKAGWVDQTRVIPDRVFA